MPNKIDLMLFESDSFDPWYNLAVEEILLDSVAENQHILYLWQNKDTVVIGKHQNAWKECRTSLLEAEGGYLARRLSGGGAVFHDLGNLNFTFLMNQANYNLEKQTGVILAAVQKLGIPAQMSGRNDLTVEGRKFSGNAFCFRKNSAYHHGTILVSGNFEKMTRYLQVSQEKIRSKGIDSVRSRVVNLNEYYPSLTINQVKEVFAQEFLGAYAGTCSGITPKMQNAGLLDQSLLQKLYTKYASWEWRYGEAPKFDLEISTRFPWGEIQIGMQLEQGIIRQTEVYSDAMDEAFIGMLPQALTDVPLKPSLMAKAIRRIKAGTARMSMQEDLAGWLMTKEF